MGVSLLWGKYKGWPGESLRRYKDVGMTAVAVSGGNPDYDDDHDGVNSIDDDNDDDFFKTPDDTNRAVNHVIFRINIMNKLGRNMWSSVPPTIVYSWSVQEAMMRRGG